MASAQTLGRLRSRSAEPRSDLRCCSQQRLRACVRELLAAQRRRAFVTMVPLEAGERGCFLEAEKRRGTTGERGKRFTMLTAITTVKRISVVCANMAGFSLARFCMPVHHGLRLSRAARKPSRTAHRGRKKTVRPAPFGSAFLSALDEAQHVSGMRARRSVGAERVGEKKLPKGRNVAVSSS